MTTAVLTTYKWTIEDYHRLVDSGVLDDKHVELLNGEIVEMAPEGIPHAGLSSDGADYLRELLGSRVKVREGNPITLPNDSEPEPDIAVVQPLGDVYSEDHHPYPENIFLLIEFSNSSLAKDLEIKAQTYAVANIQEYWVINLKARELIVFRSPTQTGYQSERILTQGSIAPIAFPDISVSIQKLLKRKGRSGEG
jgi:Uma2 family endonuclease